MTDRDTIMTEGGVRWGSPGRRSSEPDYAGGIALFSDLRFFVLKTLVEKGYTHFYKRQNNGPEISQMMELMERFPDLKGEGYAVSEERDDRRITLTGLTYQGKTSPELREAFATLFSDADHYINTESELYAWYD